MTQTALGLGTGTKSVLIYGPTGSGKTTLFTTLPGKKLLYIFDPGTLDTIAGLDIDYASFLPDSHLGIRAPIPKSGKSPVKDRRAPKPHEPLAYAEFEDHVEEQLATGFKGYDWVGFASLTSLQVITMDRLLFISNRQGIQPEWSDFNMVGETIMAIFRAVLHSGVSIFAEGHSDLVQDEVSKRIQNQFDITKGVRRHLPRLVTDVWVSMVKNVQGKPEYSIQTSPDREWPMAKNSLDLEYFEKTTVNLKEPREKQGAGRWL